MFNWKNLKITGLSLLGSTVLVAAGLVAVEPSFREAEAVTDNVVVTQAVTAGITISDGADITMTALTTSQNTAVGTSSWVVTTNSSGGYSLSVFASTAPALSRSGGGGNIADYTPAVAETPETWSVTGAAEFGFSAYGSDIPTATYGTDPTPDCVAAANVPSTTLKWRDFDLTASQDFLVTASGVPTTTSGSTSNLCVATQQAGIFAASGTYTATITGTALAL